MSRWRGNSFASYNNECNAEIALLYIDSKKGGVLPALNENKKPKYKIIEMIRMYFPKFHMKPTASTIDIAENSAKGIVIICHYLSIKYCVKYTRSDPALLAERDRIT